MTGTQPSLELLTVRLPRRLHGLAFVQEQRVVRLLAFTVAGRSRGQMPFDDYVFAKEAR
jgi:hypothetical protein